MSLENRSNSALFKRAEQLRRWEESDTNREAPVPNNQSRKIQFPSGCIFLAACAAGDTEEIERLLQKGTDINTANVDGLTALHQACIDDNLEMVEFLVQHGADVNRGDNEGWTPLHATASCGFVSIARFLIENGANVAAVNNDAELPLDIAESDEMEDMLQQDINAKGIDCDEARNEEERLMLADAKEWLNSGRIDDVPHPKTGATALHVAAAKGYIKVMSVLLQGGYDVNVRDFDGWTPLHAAAHWGQREACEMLAENFCDMDIRNCVGQTAFDVADTEIFRLLEELKKKQATLQKDQGDINAIVQKKGTIAQKRRSSITRMSVTDKSNLINKDASTERQLLDRTISEEEGSNKVKKVELEIKAESEREDTTADNEVEKKNRVNKVEPARVPVVLEVNKTVPTTAPTSPPKTPTPVDGDDGLSAWRRPGSFRTRNANGREEPSVRGLSLRIGEKDGPTQKATSPTGTPNRISPETPEVVLRRTQSFEADEKRSIREEPKPPVGQEHPTTTATAATVVTTSVTSSPTKITTSPPTATSPLPASQVRRSFVPPVRDEESETQRKAHAKRVRETRRSTQGVTLEEIKSAEQLVKKKNQQQLHQATQQLTNNEQPPDIIPSTNSTSVSATITTATPTVPSGAKGEDGVTVQERRPSWRLRVDNSDRSKFLLEDARNRSSEPPGTYVRRTSGSSLARPSSAPVESVTADATVTLALRRQSRPPDDKEQDKENDVRNAQATQGVIQRRRRPKRRSTGVVHVDMDEIDPDRQDSPSRGDGDDSLKMNNDESGNDWSSHSSRLGSASGDSPASSRAVTPAHSATKDSSENGEIDYKKLYGEVKVENERLREKLKKTEDTLSDAKSQIEKVTAAAAKNSLSELEKRERRAMERKLSEMEEELKLLEQYKSENQRLKDENGALIRVISKLSK